MRVDRFRYHVENELWVINFKPQFCRLAPHLIIYDETQSVTLLKGTHDIWLVRHADADWGLPSPTSILCRKLHSF